MSRIIDSLNNIDDSTEILKVKDINTPVYSSKNDTTISAESTTVIPIASGKGGVGKTNISVNLGIYMAQKMPDKKIILIDGDFGLPNLDIVLGLRSRKNFSKILTASKNDMQTDSLKNYIQKTTMENLFFIGGGDDSLLRLSNLYKSQLEKIIQEIKNLQSDFVIFDLGASAHSDVLDFFSIVNSGIVIITPEPTSMRTGYIFLKNAIFRKLNKEFVKLPQAKSILKIFENPEDDRIKNIDFLFKVLGKINNGNRYIQLIKNTLLNFKPKVIINRAENTVEALESFSYIKEKIKNTFNIELGYFGHIAEDINVSKAVKKEKPFYTFAPKSNASKSLSVLAEKIISGDEFKIERNFFMFGSYLKKFLKI